MLRNLATGLYLGVEGVAENGTPVIAVAKRFRWDIRPDEQDSSTFRCVVTTPKAWGSAIDCGALTAWTGYSSRTRTSTWI